MDTERFKRVEEIFEEAAALPPAEREAYLAAACAGDDDLRRQVESLLSADSASGEFLEKPAAPGGAELARAIEAAEVSGKRTGHYKLLRKIGEGGMSQVFLAVRADDEYQKRVALKIVRQDLDREDLLRRFRTERQILAGLDHPNIARLLDGGTTDDGLPYFVMDYIDGIPIDQYCDDRRLSIPERLELFRTVCSAVQYAHQNLVVHRDIKASNILVDGDGVPKLLDFGIAKLLKPDQFAGQVDYTATWMRPMTPRYASPEQVQGKLVTTSTDVYSLGVLLYKLLTGHLPYRFEGKEPQEFGRVVVEDEPELPSISVDRTETDPGAGEITPGGVSHARRTQPVGLKRQLAGDLDNILLMALRKEPQRRYSSVEQFSDDLRRYAGGLPVAARTETFGYRTGKFLKRNRWPVTASIALLLLLVGFALTMAVQAQRIAEERDQARRERDRAERAIWFLEGIFEISDPTSPQGEEITAREILERGAARVETELSEDPETRATLMNSIGRVYSGLGLYDRAESLIREALEIRTSLLAADDPLMAESRDSLGTLFLERGQLDEAEPLLRRALRDRRAAFGDAHTAVADSSFHLGRLLQEQGHYEEAGDHYREALRIHEDAGGDPIERSKMQVYLASLATETGDFPEAERGFREALEIRRRVLGDEHALVAEGLNDFGVFYGMQGDFDRSEPLLREALEIRRRSLGEEHPSVGEGMNNLGMLLKQMGRLDEAESLYREALIVQRKWLGDDHPRVTVQVHNLARLLHAKGDLADAEAMFREALVSRRKVLGDMHSYTGQTLAGLGSVLIDRERPAEAEAPLREALAIYAESLPAGHWRVAEARSFLGDCLARSGRSEEAEPLLLSSYESLTDLRGPDNPRTVEALERLVGFYESSGRPDDAARYRASQAD